MTIKPRDGDGSYALTAVFSREVQAIPNLRAFVPECRALVRGHRRLSRRVDSVAGPAHGPGSDRLRRLAERRGLPYIAIGEGFIRSLGPAEAGFATMSLIADPVGFHDDPARPSALERMLAGPGVFDTDGAIAAIARIRQEQVGHLNLARPMSTDDLDLGARSLVVVVDQRRDDPTIEPGRATERRFADMLDAALDEHPGAVVLVKLDPEVAAGRAEGFLAGRARRLGVATLIDDVTPLSIAERADRVFTVTSHFGMEALICGTPVTCFGLPFYAGWGATDDRLFSPRRARRRSTAEIFAAAYLDYCRYVDPITGARVGLDRILDRLVVMKRVRERTRGRNIAVGFAADERERLTPFFTGTAAAVVFTDDVAGSAREAAEQRGKLWVSRSAEPPGLRERARRAAVPVVAVEEGFLRRLAPAHDLQPWTSIHVEHRGMNGDRPPLCGLVDMLSHDDVDPETLAEARSLRHRLTLGSGAPPAVAERLQRDPRCKLLVLGDGPHDATGALRSGASGDVALLQAVRRQRRDAMIVYLPAAGGQQEPRGEAGRYADLILDDVAPDALLAVVDEVHVNRSLHGLAALLHGRKVVTHGAPFYAGWGLTEDHGGLPRRCRELSLDQLVAATLLTYPCHIDPATGLPCDATTLLDRSSERQAPRLPVVVAGPPRRRVSQILRQLVPFHRPVAA